MIDKTKAYRFKGDSERWESAHQGSCIRSTATNDCIPMLAAERLHSRGILLEYPELPGGVAQFLAIPDSWLLKYGKVERLGIDEESE